MAVSFCSTESISTAAQYVTPDNKIYWKNVKNIGFSAPKSYSLACLVKGATQLCTSKNECNKLDLTADQYF
jgi:hypothetical protein